MSQRGAVDPTGQQVHLRHHGPNGTVTAHIAQVGASLRGLRVGETDLIAPYPLGAPAPSASGIVLVPWPNRVRDGRWDDAGTERQLAITEPARGNASHGLLRFSEYDITEGSAEATLAARIYPQTGYPYLLETEVAFALTDDGIHIRHRVVNSGTAEAPVALGTHPFLALGETDSADLVLHSPGASFFEVDERMLPVRESPVDPATDLRGGRRVGELQLDTGYSELARDADGLVRHSLTAIDGRRVTLWQGAGFDYAQLFTTDRYPGRSTAIAIEPMTAPADAFNSGRGLRRLSAGESWQLEWGITYRE